MRSINLSTLFLSGIICRLTRSYNHRPTDLQSSLEVSGGDHVGVRGSGPPYFLAVWGSICTWTPHFYRRAAATNRLWSNLVLLMVVLCNYLDHHFVWYNSTSRQLTCPVNLSLAGVKLPFPRHTHLCSNCCWCCRHTTAPCLHACRRSPQSQSFGGEHQHSAVMGTSCKK